MVEKQKNKKKKVYRCPKCEIGELKTKVMNNTKVTTCTRCMYKHYG